GFNRSETLLGLALYMGVFWTVKFNAYSPCNTDAIMGFFQMAILYLGLSGWYIPALVLLPIAVTAREQALLLAPALALMVMERRGRRPVSNLTLAAAFPAASVAAFLLIRYFITPARDYDSLGMVWKQLAILGQCRFYPRIALSLLSGLGAIPLLFLYRIRSRAWRFLLSPPWLVLTIGGMLSLFGGRDKARLFLFILPLLVVVAVKMLVPGNRSPAWSWSLATGTLAMHLYLGYHLTPMTGFVAYLQRMVPMHAPDFTLPGALLRAGGVTALWILFAGIHAAVFRKRPEIRNQETKEVSW
ncbi:hypothetical protein JW905_19305, partial [bacterium]|nr:hypothetical protein [candidate division CSSED10-310 bacterium]